jgi:alanyl-tRNA synthetase
VKQAGSFVDEDRFRFDYTIYNAPSEEDINKIEKIVNEKIQNDDPVRCFETTREFAEEIGAMALFEEKYDKFVRVVEIDNYSRELCGGTHTGRTGEIGLFKIISDSSVGANLRRIEAVTGMSAYSYLKESKKILKKVSESLDVEESKIPDAVEKIRESLKKKEEQLRNMQIKIAKKEILDRFNFKPGDKRLKIIDFDFSKSTVPDIEINSAGIVADELINYFGGLNTFIISGCISGNKSVVILNTTKDLIKKGIDCGKIAAEVSKKLNGGGGGKPHFAQMGLPDKNNIERAIKLVRDRVIEVAKK